MFDSFSPPYTQQFKHNLGLDLKTFLCSEAENIMVHVDVSADGLCRIFTIAMGTCTINMFQESG